MDFRNICCDIYMLEAASKLLELACAGTDEQVSAKQTCLFYRARRRKRNLTDEEPTHEWEQNKFAIYFAEREGGKAIRLNLRTERLSAYGPN